LELQQGERTTPAADAFPFAAANMTEIKRKVGLDMLADARLGEYDSAYGLLSKILGNIVQNPDEPKYKRLRTSNAKINALLQTRGVRALLIGCGFVEEGDALVLPEGAEAIEATNAGLAGLLAQHEQREAAEAQRKMSDMEERKAKMGEQDEARKNMKLSISDDAAARKEPGWTAKAAGVKGGRDIVTASDIGASGKGG